MLQSNTQVGRLDTRVIIKHEVITKDIYNQDVKTWQVLSTVWSKMDDKGGSEGYQADQLTAVRNTTFTIRFLSTVTEKMRIILDARIYEIVSMNRPDRRRTLELRTILLDELDPDEDGGAFAALAFSSGFNV